MQPCLKSDKVSKSDRGVEQHQISKLERKPRTTARFMMTRAEVSETFVQLFCRYSKTYKRHQTVCHRTICPGNHLHLFLLSCIWLPRPFPPSSSCPTNTCSECIITLCVDFCCRSLWLSALSQRRHMSVRGSRRLPLRLPTRLCRRPTLRSVNEACYGYWGMTSRDWASHGQGKPGKAE